MNSRELNVTAEEEPDISLREMLRLMDQSTAQEAKSLDREILSLVRNLGGNASSYRRERGRAIRAAISEIYSPPCVSAVAKMCPSFGILPGFALDATTNDTDGRHWDFDEEEMRDRAWAKVTRSSPYYS